VNRFSKFFTLLWRLW